MSEFGGRRATGVRAVHYEYKLVSGLPAAAEQQLNELAAMGWELVSVTSSQGPLGGFLFVNSSVRVVVTLRRTARTPHNQAEPYSQAAEEYP